MLSHLIRFNPWDLHDESRDQTHAGCPLTFIHTHTHTHTHTQGGGGGGEDEFLVIKNTAGTKEQFTGHFYIGPGARKQRKQKIQRRQQVHKHRTAERERD